MPEHAATVSAEVSPDSITVPEVLAKLHDPQCDRTEGQRLVLQLEYLPFEDDLREEACDALREFIAHNRDSQDTRDLVAVGAAVRKLVLNLRPEELDSVSWLLEPGHRGSPSADLTRRQQRTLSRLVREEFG